MSLTRKRAKEKEDSKSRVHLPNADRVEDENFSIRRHTVGACDVAELYNRQAAVAFGTGQNVTDIRSLLTSFATRNASDEWLEEGKEQSVTKIPKLVAAFDFGTMYSGYAFSFYGEPMKIIIRTLWNSGSNLSHKTPTSLLLNPKGEFDSFGYEAEDKYANLVVENSSEGWYFFKRFKMILHNDQGLTREATVQDVNGRSMPALTVFAMAIGYMRDHFLGELHKKYPSVTESDMRYVLTVPAIWSDKAKQFMREAGIKARIDTERLTLALEPEAAAIWCQTLPVKVYPNREQNIWSWTLEITILSANRFQGGTVDISVHEKIKDGSLKQLHRASGGPWGGCAVDENYLNWLTAVFGKSTIDTLKTELILDYLEMFRYFELKKRTIKHDTTKKLLLMLPPTLAEIHQQLEHRSIIETIRQQGLEDKVTYSYGKLQLDISIVKEWFKEPIDKIIRHIKKIFEAPNMTNVDIILLVGGFGECDLVQESLKQQIQNKSWIFPEESGLVVLKGAVLFGHIPGIVSKRVAPYTYGMNKSCPFDPKFHPESKLIISNGIRYADNVFGIFVRCGEEIMKGHEVKRIFTPIVPQETRVNIFTSTHPNPQFVDDPGCQMIGSLTVSHPENEPLENKVFEVTFFFGDTELHVTIRMLKNNIELKAIIDCLSPI